ncbi:hypothetical protein A9A72_121347 [Stutzerimonas stutzeri]|uniref:Uncharacterized protein n=1 Tax=Stutzerimonas stutzeri TaxID=316 RepID=A0A5S5BIV0_STUST|nr:hypothetical protein A9A72_121347 [Stutzerimonas stutzeri]
MTIRPDYGDGEISPAVFEPRSDSAVVASSQSPLAGHAGYGC